MSQVVQSDFISSREWVLDGRSRYKGIRVRRRTRLSTYKNTIYSNNLVIPLNRPPPFLRRGLRGDPLNTISTNREADRTLMDTCVAQGQELLISCRFSVITIIIY